MDTQIGNGVFKHTDRLSAERDELLNQIDDCWTEWCIDSYTPQLDSLNNKIEAYCHVAQNYYDQAAETLAACTCYFTDDYDYGTNDYYCSSCFSPTCSGGCQDGTSEGQDNPICDNSSNPDTSYNSNGEEGQ